MHLEGEAMDIPKIKGSTSPEPQVRVEVFGIEVMVTVDSALLIEPVCIAQPELEDVPPTMDRASTFLRQHF